MKILEGSFQCEANTFCSQRAEIEDFEVFQGDVLLAKMAATEVFRQAGAEVVPLIYASALPSGQVSRKAFEFYKERFIEAVKQEKAIDGIYLYLHGSMYVENLGSGEEWLVKAIRKVAGENVPISVALDYHANLSDDFLNNVNAVQGFRTAPHTDHDDTERRAAKSLLKCIERKICPAPSYVRIPFLGGDAATTEREPFVTITRHLKQMDEENNVISAAFFNGQPWYDAEYTGNCAVVYGTDKIETGKKALRLAEIFWGGRENLQIKHAEMPEEAVKNSLEKKEGILFVTDSGDNTTAGADGKGTLLLRKYLEENQKGVLVCGIFAEETVTELLEKEVGSEVEFTLCKGKQEAQEIETEVCGILRQKGVVCGWTGEEAGEGVLITCGNVDIVLTNARAAFTTPAHFEKMGICPQDYRVIVIKMGYLFPKLREISSQFIFAMTPGISTNDFGTLDYQRLKKKMYPVDRNITWEEIRKEAEVTL